MNRWIADAEMSARLAAVDRDIDECEALDRLVYGRESRFWRTTAEVMLTVCVGLLMFASVVIR